MRDDRNPWWWGFGMGAAGRIVVGIAALLSVLAVAAMHGSELLMLPGIVVLSICLPGTSELVRRRSR